MAIQVSSGEGIFPNNAIVTSILDGQRFIVSAAPNVQNPVGSNTVITGGGNDFSVSGAMSGAGSLASTITLPSGQTTAEIELGMAVTVIGGTGKFRPGTTVVQIIDEQKFRVSAQPTAPTGTPLSGATVSFTAPDVIPLYNAGAVSHAIANNSGQISSNTSTAQGDYIIKLIPDNLLQSGADVPYRVVWKFPDGSTGFTEGVFEAATLNSPSINVLKINKSGTGLNAVYTVTPL
jgi:hypothetical protein